MCHYSPSYGVVNLFILVDCIEKLITHTSTHIYIYIYIYIYSILIVCMYTYTYTTYAMTLGMTYTVFTAHIVGHSLTFV